MHHAGACAAPKRGHHGREKKQTAFSEVAKSALLYSL